MSGDSGDAGASDSRKLVVRPLPKNMVEPGKPGWENVAGSGLYELAVASVSVQGLAQSDTIRNEQTHQIQSKIGSSGKLLGGLIGKVSASVQHTYSSTTAEIRARTNSQQFTQQESCKFTTENPAGQNVYQWTMGGTMGWGSNTFRIKTCHFACSKKTPPSNVVWNRVPAAYSCPPPTKK